MSLLIFFIFAALFVVFLVGGILHSIKDDSGDDSPAEAGDLLFLFSNTIKISGRLF